MIQLWNIKKQSNNKHKVKNSSYLRWGKDEITRYIIITILVLVLGDVFIL